MTRRTDILIVGGGLVGASLALALRGSPWHMALAEARPVEPPPAPSEWDVRMYAISPASRAFLEGLGIWQRLDEERIAPVQAMRVRGDRRSTLDFSAHDSGVAALAWIVESGALARALWAALEHQPRLELLCPAVPQALDASADDLRVNLSGGRAIVARLVVGADGARSFVRTAAGIDAEPVPYGQSGVVANFACEHPHRSIASQWFRDDGVLAWLPLPGERISMVWSAPQAHAEELLALPDEALCARVAAAGGHALGDLRLITRPAAFPLAMLKARSLISQRVALIGDAAHVVHPLAGQGVNLGFGDAQALADVLGEAANARRDADPGARLLLRCYERKRAEHILAMRWTTDGLARLFASRAPGAQAVRNLGMNVVDRLPLLKNLLVSQAIAGGLPSQAAAQRGWRASGLKR
ncbi:MAG: UbiH/UbiF family hydroxylase [Betaproteobacteria bacterium]|nr:UbiH/UbiF family hydroxylase [Betaproteobacteria bacterium]